MMPLYEPICRVRKAGAFTLIELLVVISIIALLIAILLPAPASARVSAQKQQGTTQMRGIQQGLLIASQDNKGFYPGAYAVATLSSESFVDESQIEKYSGGGALAGSHVSARWCLRYEGEYFTPDYGFSPGEIEPERLTRFDPNAAPGTYTRDNYLTSFALPQLIVDLPGTLTAEGRLREWSDSAGSRAVTVSDRMHSGDNHDLATHSSIWNATPGGWEGAIAFNDNHCEFFTTPEVPDTAYGEIKIFCQTTCLPTTHRGSNAVNHSNAKQIMRWRSGQLIRQVGAHALAAPSTPYASDRTLLECYSDVLLNFLFESRTRVRHD
ncbi:MAG: prepilin-type N-terminal cleavage/methylation domain-containing protein [Planctomycetota bacterium]